MKELQLSKRSYSQINYIPTGVPGVTYVTPPSYPTPPFFDPEPVKLKVFAGIGAIDTPEDICSEMTRFATMMAEKGWILRSGGAPGADVAFEKGYENYPHLKEIYLPWKNFNNNPSHLYNVSPEAIAMAAKHHPNWAAASRKQGAVKLLGRDSYQILGLDLSSPCDLVVCWTKGGREEGGTAQAMRIAKAWNIRIMNLAEYKVK